MNWRLVVAIAVVVGLLAILVKPAVRVLNSMRVNKAVYLTNLGRTGEAQERLRRILQVQPSNIKARAAFGEALARTGEFQKAYTVLEFETNNTEAVFWRAVSAYRLDEITTAAALFRKVRNGEGPLPEGYQQLAELAVQTLEGPAGVMPPSMPFLGSEVLKDIWRSLAGALQLRNRQWLDAASYYERLFKRGRPGIFDYSRACTAYIFSGEYVKAQSVLESSTSMAAILHDLQMRFYKAASDLRTTTSVLADLQQNVEMEERLQRGLAWVHVQKARSGDRRFPLTREPLVHEDDPVRLFLSAEIDELGGNYSSAYQKYARIWNQHPNLSAMIRMRDLAGDAAELPQLLVEFAEGLPGSILLSANDMATTGSTSRGTYVVFHEPGAAEMKVLVGSAGLYTITLVASVARAEGKGALVELVVNRREAEMVYVAREGWDCYSLDIPLQAGSNALRLYYTSNADATATEEKRSLYLMGILISQKAADN